MTVKEMMKRESIRRAKEEEEFKRTHPKFDLEKGRPWREANERIKKQFGLVKHLDITEIDVGGDK